MKCLYFRSFLAFHSPVVEGVERTDGLQKGAGMLAALVLVPHTSGIQRGRMGRCSFHTRVVIHTVPGAVDESYPGTSFTKSRVRLQVLRGGLD